MSFGQNLQFLRKMRNKMTQEELAEKMCLSNGFVVVGKDEDGAVISRLSI